MKIKSLIILSVAAFALTACSTDADAELPETFDSAEHLIETVNARTDMECDPDAIEEKEVIEDPSLQWDQASCDTESFIYYTFSTKSTDFILTTIEETGLAKTRVARGDDWVFMGDHQQATSVRNSLEGTQPNFARPTPTATPTPEPEAAGFNISCHNEDSEDTGTFTSFEQAWDLDPADRASCNVGWKHEDQIEAAELHDFSDTELEAIETAGYDDNGSLTTLYGQCAESHLGDHKASKPWSEGQAQEAQGALLLCPEHPERDVVEQRIADAAEIEDQWESGERIVGGPHRVGEDIQPGTYVSEDDEGFESCYWERLDSAGNIIDNNFISNGFRAQVTVAASDYSFSAEGCGEWVRQ